MPASIDVDVWVRGTQHAATHVVQTVSPDAERWTDADVRHLLTGMLLALEREKHPGGEPPAVTLRGFNWIVTPDERGGVLVHLEMQMGTASAGPFVIDQARLSDMIGRAMARGDDRVH